MSRRDEERLKNLESDTTEDDLGAYEDDEDIWNPGEINLFNFTGENPGDPADINGLCIFLKEIVAADFSPEINDGRLMGMMMHFCEHVGAQEEDAYVWKKNPPSDLCYGIMLAAIEDDATRNALQAQIRSKTLPAVMSRINEDKAQRGVSHKEAFLDLDPRVVEEIGIMVAEREAARMSGVPRPIVSAATGETGRGKGRGKDIVGDTGGGPVR